MSVWDQDWGMDVRFYWVSFHSRLSFREHVEELRRFDIDLHEQH